MKYRWRYCTLKYHSSAVSVLALNSDLLQQCGSAPVQNSELLQQCGSVPVQNSEVPVLQKVGLQKEPCNCCVDEGFHTGRPIHGWTPLEWP